MLLLSVIIDSKSYQQQAASIDVELIYPAEISILWKKALYSLKFFEIR